MKGSLFTFNGIQAFHNDLQNGTFTCVDAVLFYLHQIEQHRHLNAWVEVYEQEALDRAQQLDEKLKCGTTPGALFGVVVGLKDVIAHKGHPLTAASNILQGYSSLYNATVTERLLVQDAIIIGRQNCDEFGMGSTSENSYYGSVKNALDEKHIAGGSSGGSAVAVQANMCMISLGSDTGGSVRQPADHCGVIGFKPTYGTISRYGLIAYASSFDQIGIFAKHISDVALVLDSISGPDGYDTTMNQQQAVPSFPIKPLAKKPRIGYLANTLHHKDLSPEIANGILAYIEILKNEGYDVAPAELSLLDYLIPTYYVLTTAEAASNLSRYDGIRYGSAPPINGNEDPYSLIRTSGFGTEVKRRIMLGNFVLSAGYYDEYFSQAQKVRRLLVQETRELFNRFDFLILPTVPSTAPKLGTKRSAVENFLADIFTVYANLVGIPAISIPLFLTSYQHPFGLQMLTSAYNDLPLLAFANEMLQLKNATKQRQSSS